MDIVNRETVLNVNLFEVEVTLQKLLRLKYKNKANSNVCQYLQSTANRHLASIAFNNTTLNCDSRFNPNFKKR